VITAALSAGVCRRASAEAGIDMDKASAECDDVAAAGTFEHDSCMVDYCGSNGEEDVSAEKESLKHFEDDDKNDGDVALLQTAEDPGDKALCNDLIKHEDAKMDSPEAFKSWCMNEQKFSDEDCSRAVAKLGPHPWTQEKIDDVCGDEALALLQKGASSKGVPDGDCKDWLSFMISVAPIQSKFHPKT